MTNAKSEFITHTSKVNSSIVCALLTREVFDSEIYEYIDVDYILPVNYTPDEYEKFLSEIDYEYNAGYGGQEIDGTIFYSDDSWSERGEYDGSEWWEYKKLPEIPFQCRR